MKIMKKFVSLLVVVLLMGQMSSMALAHEGEKGHDHLGTGTVYHICNVAGCNITEMHRHGRKCYYGHAMGDGHDYHALCSVKGCTLTGVHQHDGAYYFAHTSEDGHDYHVACSAKGCTEVTEHTHDAGQHHSGGNGHHGRDHT